MNKKLKKFLKNSLVVWYILLFCAAFCALLYLCYFFGLFYDLIYNLVLIEAASETLAILAAEIITFILAVITSLMVLGINYLCSSFVARITSNYQSFKSEGNDFNFSEVYKDPTIALKDKILFFLIHLIYCIQFPFLYFSSQISKILTLEYMDDGRIIIPLMIVNSILTIPVALLELVKYPLIKLFSPLGLNVKQLSFLFNVSDVGTGSQSVHTSSFEYSIFQCAQDLKQKFGVQPNVLDKEFENYINGSSELIAGQKEQLKLYLNFNNSNRAIYRESRTELTLTQAANLVLAAAKNQKLDIDLLKCMLLMRLQEGSGACYLGMFNRIIYSLSSLEAKNNFTVEVNSQVYERMPSITEEFLRNYKSKKLKILKDNFDNFYSEGDIDLEIKSNIDKLMEEVKQFVFNKLYVDYYNRYGKEVGRGPIKHKLKELITDDDIKEAISAVIDDIEIPSEPSTCFEQVKAFFGGHARFSAG